MTVAVQPNSVAPAPSSRSSPPLRTYLLATAVFVVDGFVQGTGVLSILTLLFVAPTLILLSILRWRNRRELKRLFLSGVLYGCVAVGALFLIDADSKGAGKRAEAVIAACNQFKRQNGRYPPGLDALVPACLPAIPPARQRARGYERFHYIYERTNAILFYISSPLDGELRYDFARAAWSPSD